MKPPFRSPLTSLTGSRRFVESRRISASHLSGIAETTHGHIGMLTTDGNELPRATSLAPISEGRHIFGCNGK